jgi:AbrB family looped-hinge helix DNA binding protein
MEIIMEATSVTSKGQVTIPKSLRQRFGIRQGSKIEFNVVGDHVELHVVNNPVEVVKSGFGMLKTRKSAVPVDFDAAMLLGKRKSAK